MQLCSKDTSSCLSTQFSLDATNDDGRAGRYTNHSKSALNLLPKVIEAPDGEPHICCKEHVCRTGGSMQLCMVLIKSGNSRLWVTFVRSSLSACSQRPWKTRSISSSAARSASPREQEGAKGSNPFMIQWVNFTKFGAFVLFDLLVYVLSKDHSKMATTALLLALWQRTTPWTSTDSKVRLTPYFVLAWCAASVEYIHVCTSTFCSEQLLLASSVHVNCRPKTHQLVFLFSVSRRIEL